MNRESNNIRERVVRAIKEQTGIIVGENSLHKLNNAEILYIEASFDVYVVQADIVTIVAHCSRRNENINIKVFQMFPDINL